MCYNPSHGTACSSRTLFCMAQDTLAAPSTLGCPPSNRDIGIVPPRETRAVRRSRDFRCSNTASDAVIIILYGLHRQAQFHRHTPNCLHLKARTSLTRISEMNAESSQSVSMLLVCRVLRGQTDDLPCSPAQLQIPQHSPNCSHRLVRIDRERGTSRSTLCRSRKHGSMPKRRCQRLRFRRSTGSQLPPRRAARIRAAVLLLTGRDAKFL